MSNGGTARDEVMSDVSEYLSALQPTHVRDALSLLDAGEATQFAESTKYDLVFDTRRYPPKRVAGLAMQLMTGQPFGPQSFKGGEESVCFRALRRCGFTVVPKETETGTPLVAVLAEVLDLQTKYQSKNSPEMQRRGWLIRNALPNHIRAHVGVLEPTFSRRGFSLEVEGSDGVGRKNESAWVRLFDDLMSPSATKGWYVVLHFSRKGETFYATVGCGATTFRAGSLIDIPANELRQRVQWARNVAATVGFPISQFDHQIELNGNDLSRQFERATAFAKRYDLESFNESVFWHDIERLCSLLVELYEAERLGRAPLAEQPEVAGGEADIERAVSPQSAGRHGQGRGLTAEERKAVEVCAMQKARDSLSAAGFAAIKDVSRSESYDFSAKRGGTDWLIEVKGTTSASADVFLLTASELVLHRENLGRTALALVAQIDLNRAGGNVVASGGVVELIAPWAPDTWDFEPTAFRARRK